MCIYMAERKNRSVFVCELSAVHNKLRLLLAKFSAVYPYWKKLKLPKKFDKHLKWRRRKVFTWFCGFLCFLFHATTFPHVPPRCALLACASLYLCMPPSAKGFWWFIPWPLLFCWNHTVFPACILPQWWGGAFLQIPTLKRFVVHQNSLQAPPDLVISVVNQCFTLFSWRVSMMSLPVKLCPKYFTGMMGSTK